MHFAEERGKAVQNLWGMIIMADMALESKARIDGDKDMSRSLFFYKFFAKQTK
jgi:hypothetical protein